MNAVRIAVLLARHPRARRVVLHSAGAGGRGLVRMTRSRTGRRILLATTRAAVRRKMP